MNPKKEELEALKSEIKKEFLTEVRRRAIEKLFSDNKDRIDRYLAKVSGELAGEISKEFPL